MKKLFLKCICFVLFMVSPNVYSYDFSWDNLLLADAKLTPNFDYEVYVDSYMKLYREPIWKRYKNDEFELEDKRQETIQIMKDRFDQFDLDQEFFIHSFIKFGEYNFKKEEFPLEGFSATSHFSESRKRYISNNAFPYAYKVFFKNYDIVKNLEMDKDSAKVFLQSKKKHSGYVDRKLPVQIKFKVEERSGVGELRAKVTEVILYESKDASSILHVFK